MHVYIVVYDVFQGMLFYGPRFASSRLRQQADEHVFALASMPVASLAYHMRLPACDSGGRHVPILIVLLPCLPPCGLLLTVHQRVAQASRLKRFRCCGLACHMRPTALVWQLVAQETHKIMRF